MKFEINKNAFQVEWQGKKEWVIVSDDNVNHNDWYFFTNGEQNVITKRNIDSGWINPRCKKITHSTIPNIGQQIEVVDEKDGKIQCKLI